ncbi:MAG: YdiU family protein [Pseudomonadota bacterium]
MKNLNFTNRYYKLSDDFYQAQLPCEIKNPYIIHINPLMAKELDLDISSIDTMEFAQFSSGNSLLENSHPTASIYAGHQFGHFVPQLGDGRALLLGEIKNKANQYWELQLKGSGKTPFSRSGDGRAVLRSTIREYLCSEAMAGLNIPTTRSLSMVGSEEEVYRETIETGAVMLRLSPSFIRFGSFELFSSREQYAQVKQLADFVIENYYPDITKQLGAASDINPYKLLLKSNVINTAELIAKWQAVGFNHGVMNTDNMSIIGLTLDYGPFAFLDHFDNKFICNHSDHQGRYSFENQPFIGFWNLNCLANAMLSLISVDEAKEVLGLYESSYYGNYYSLMFKKLGLFNTQERQYEKLVDSLLELMQSNKVDYSVFFRQLSNFSLSQDRSTLQSKNKLLIEMFAEQKDFIDWLEKYMQALVSKNENISSSLRKSKMDKINPKYILRNYIAQTVIEKVELDKDYNFFDQWLKILQSPFDEHPEMESFSGVAPEWAKTISISCSS